MKIAIVGCGAVGGYYGAMLCRQGQDVHFLLRSDYDAVRREGVNIRSPRGDFNVRPKCAKHPSDIGASDVVLIALKTTANEQFENLLPPLVGTRTAVVTLQNGLGNEELLKRLFPVEQILGGLCFVCLNRVAPGIIQHLAHGTIVLGEYLRPPEQRTRNIAAMFNDSGVTCKVADNLELAHWEKLAWNIPFNGLGVAAVAGYDALVNPTAPLAVKGDCLATDRLLADPRWERLVRELMIEVISVAGKLGYRIPGSLVDHQIERTRMMGAYKASTLLDFERGQPLEFESLFQEPLNKAKRAGVLTPRLEALCNVLGKLNRQG